jgi:signal transduction histidine kinase
MLERGQRRAGVEQLLDVYQRALDGRYGRLNGPLSTARDRVRALLETWVGPRGALTGAAPGLVAQYVQLEAEAWRQRALAERQRGLRLLLPDLVAALRAAPPPVGEVAHYTSQGAAGSRLVACVRVAAVPGAGLPHVVGVEVDLAGVASEVVAPRLERFGREHAAVLAVRDRRDAVVAGGGRPAFTDAASAQARVAFEAMLPFWTMEVAPARAASDVVGIARIWLQAGLVILLLVAMALGARWALRAAHRSIELGALKAEFVANVSHELRTPLAAIRLYTEMLKRIPADDTDRRTRYLDTVLRESERLHALIDDILGFSRLDGGAGSYRPERLRLAEVVEAAVESLRPRLEAEGAEVTLELDVAAPQVSCDREMLETAVRNLIVNASKYSPPDRRQIRVTVRAEAGQRVALEVGDRGVGIAASERGRLFDRFYRGEAARELGVPGSGLGLALVHRVVTDHDGSIDVASELGDGTTITVWLPGLGTGDETAQGTP